jgi:hypothetical protein
MFVCLQQKAQQHHNSKTANKSFEDVANFKHGLTEKIQLHSAFGLL